VDLTQIASSSLHHAREQILVARTAVAARDGVTALRAAQEAESYARQALLLDTQQKRLDELLAQETRHLEVQLSAARREEAATRRAAERITEDLAALRRDVFAVKADSERLSGGRQAAESRARALEAQLRSSDARVRQLTETLERTATRQSHAEADLASLAAQFAATKSALETARAAASKEGRRADAVESDAQDMAASYSRRIDEMKRQQQRDAAITRARDTALARHVESSLTAEDVRAALPTVQAWKRTWEQDDLDEHRRLYAPNATIERVEVVSGNESSTRLSSSAAQAMMDSIRAEKWIAVPRSSVHAEGEAVVAELALRREARELFDSPMPAAFDFSLRRSYWRRIDGAWRIIREEWRFYEDVPNF
jgi:chromosome segregation ATPase